MRLKKALGQLWLLLALAVSVGWTQDNTGMSFLKLPVDARSAAMGEAATALYGDAAAAFRNPAALAMNTHKSLILMHNAYLADISQEFAAFQFARGTHSASIALNMVDIPGIEIRGNRPTAEPEGKTDAINLAFGLSYAYRYQTHWSFGATVKYLFEKYYLESATGWAVDLGLQRSDLLTQGLSWGLVVQNVGKMNTLKTEATPLPVIARTGVQYVLPVEWMNGRPLIAADFEQLLNADEGAFRLGTELPLLKVITLRGGLIYTPPKIRYSLGFGVNYHKFQINYAFSPYPYGLGNSHRFSLNLTF